MNTVLKLSRQLLEREKKTIQKISLGSHFTVILDDMSNIYTFGLGDFGQLGHNNRKSSRQPRQIENLAIYLAATDSNLVTSGNKSIPKATNFVGVSHISQKILVSVVFVSSSLSSFRTRSSHSS